MLLDSAKDLLWEPKRLRHCSYIVTIIIIHSAIQLHFPAIFHILFVYFPKRKAVSTYVYVVCFPHTHMHAHSPYSHILSLFIDLLELLSTWIRALNIFCSPNHCESRGHFHLGLRRLWPQDFQRLSEVQRPNISSSTALWSILRFHGLYRIDRFLRPDNNLSNIITYRGCCERRSERESSYFYFDGK